MITSSALVLCVGKDEAEFQRRAADHRPRPRRRSARDQLGGTVSEVLDKVGRYVESGQTRLYLQTLDLHDLDHLRLVAEEVMPVSVVDVRARRAPRTTTRVSPIAWGS